MTENVMQWSNLLLCNLTFPVYGTKGRDIFIIEKQSGPILQT